MINFIASFYFWKVLCSGQSNFQGLDSEIFFIFRKN